MKKIETVVFDLGGVLIDWNPRYLYKKLISDPDELEFFLTEICSPAWNAKLDEGVSFVTAVEERISAYPEYASLIQAYLKCWPEMLAGPIEGSVEILRTLHAQKTHRLLALSNWSGETFPHASSRFDFLALFEYVLLSGEEKLIKPDPRFYRILNERFKVDLESALFIDDVEKNIDAAKALGFETIHFTNPEMLRHRLIELSVL